MKVVNIGVDKSKISPYISNTLLSGIESVLEKEEKTILYLNKRGQFNSIICNDCQHLFQCPNCDISMSTHKYPSQFLCHLCSHSESIPLKCSKCHGIHLSHIGVGTQQIEESLKNHFKNKGGKNIFRFDTDTMKTKVSKQEALKSLEEADIIIGTKMITTGFNFKNVGLIGVILLEQELQIPKYNTEESVHTNIKQILGRGARNGQETEFIIQSFIPENTIVQSIVFDNYKDFFLRTLEERKLFSYPPYGEMATLEYKHTSKQKALDFITRIYQKLEQEIDETSKVHITFNESPMKKYNQFYYKIIIKGDGIRETLQLIKPEILRNSGLNIIF